MIVMMAAEPVTIQRGREFGVRREEEETAHSYSEEKKKKDVRSRGEKARWLRNNNVTFAASTNDLARSH